MSHTITCPHCEKRSLMADTHSINPYTCPNCGRVIQPSSHVSNPITININLSSLTSEYVKYMKKSEADEASWGF